MAQAEGRSPLQMPHPFYRVFRGNEYKDILKSVLECRRFKQDGLIYIEQLSMLTSALPYHWEQYPEDMLKFLKREIVEIGINRQFEMGKLINWSTGVHRLYPVVTTGDGNCLLHAAALYMWGIEDTDLILRKCLYDSLNHGSFAAANMKRWQFERTNNDRTAMSFEFRYNTGEWETEYEMVKQMASPERSRSSANLPYQSLEEFHIFILANILRRPILVISQDKMHSVQGVSLQPHPVSGLYLPVNWDPSLCCKFPILLGYHQNHFFPLLHTAPENKEEEGDLIVPIVKSDSDVFTVHFLLPNEDPMELLKIYLKCETFIHCPDNRETAVALPGVKLSCESLGETLSVWETFFNQAEFNLRTYYEEEYNPQPPDAEQNLRGYVEDVGVGSFDNQYLVSQEYPGRDKPTPRGPGQCKTPGCPYQKSVSTGDLCVECFNKGQRVNCRSPDCLNKADVGLEGFCKVCHDGSKFQKSNKMEQKVTSVPNINNGSSSEEEDRFKTRPDDLNSLAVDTVKTGTEKCIVPECELTGNPKTGDMCSTCYHENVTLLQQYEETSSREKERRHQDSDEPFVLVNNQGEEEEHSDRERQASGGRVNSKLYDRHFELLRKLNLDQDRQAIKSAAVGGNVFSQGQDKGRVNSAPPTQGSEVQKFTVKKDLCATPGCAGVRLTTSELCRTCKDNKKAPRDTARDTVRSAAVPPTSPRQLSGAEQRYYSAQDRRPCRIRVCKNPAAPPEFRFCKQCLEDMFVADMPINQGGPASAPRGNTPVEGHGYSGNAAATQRNVSGGRTSPNYQEQYEARKRSTPAPSNYRGRGQGSERDDHYYGGNIGSAPPSATVPAWRNPRDTDFGTEDLERQIRDQFVQDRSDTTPVPRNVLRAAYRERIECQRPGGCPDKMYGDPEKNDLCSKCAKEVLNPGRHGNKPRSVNSGSYDRDEDATYLRQYQPDRTFSRSAPRGQRMVDEYPPQFQQTRERENVYRGGLVVNEIPPEVADHTYQEIEETCAQPGCRRPPGNNVEKFCDQCHANYTALFSDYRQINIGGLSGN